MRNSFSFLWGWQQPLYFSCFSICTSRKCLCLEYIRYSSSTKEYWKSKSRLDFRHNFCYEYLIKQKISLTFPKGISGFHSSPPVQLCSKSWTPLVLMSVDFKDDLDEGCCGGTGGCTAQLKMGKNQKTLSLNYVFLHGHFENFDLLLVRCWLAVAICCGFIWSYCSFRCWAWSRGWICLTNNQERFDVIFGQEAITFPAMARLNFKGSMEVF